MITFKRIKAENITPELNCLFNHCANQTINIGDTRIIEINADTSLVYIIEGITKTTDEDFDAILQDWYIAMTLRGPRLKGRVFYDKKLRFRDGQYIQTSTFIRSKLTYKEGDVVQTRNSSYKLGKPADLG